MTSLEPSVVNQTKPTPFGMMVLDYQGQLLSTVHREQLVRYLDFDDFKLHYPGYETVILATTAIVMSLALLEKLNMIDKVYDVKSRLQLCPNVMRFQVFFVARFRRASCVVQIWIRLRIPVDVSPVAFAALFLRCSSEKNYCGIKLWKIKAERRLPTLLLAPSQLHLHSRLTTGLPLLYASCVPQKFSLLLTTS